MHNLTSEQKVVGLVHGVFSFCEVIEVNQEYTGEVMSLAAPISKRDLKLYIPCDNKINFQIVFGAKLY